MTAESEPSETKDFFNSVTLEKLLRINQSLLATHDLVVLLNQIAEGAQTVLGADVVVLYVYEEERDDVVVPPVIAGTLLTGQVLRTTSQKRPHRESAVFKMLRRTEALYAENARENWPAQIEGWSWERSFLQRECIVSSAAIPLTANEKVAGVLFINYRTHRSFTESERRVVELFASSAAIAIQNAQRAKRERTLREISQAIGTAEELKAKAENILDRLFEVVEYRTASLQLVQGDNETRRFLATHGFKEETADSWFLRPVSHDPLISTIVSTKKPIILSCPSKKDGWGSHPGTEAVKSWMGVPLVYGHDVVGVLTIDHDEPGFYTEAIRDEIVSFADEVAIHVRNARVYDDTQRRIRDLEIVNHVVQVLGSEIEPQEIMKAVVSEIAVRLDCTHCTIFLPKEENGEVVLAAVETHGQRREQILARRFKPGEGLAGWVFQHGEPLLLSNASVDPRFAPASDPSAQPRSMMVVPVMVGDETIGVISSDQDQLAWFGESDLRLLTALARHAGVALQRASGLDLLHHISNRIVSSPEVKVEEILDEIVKGALKLTRTSTAVIFLMGPNGRTVLRTVERPEGFHHPEPRMEGGITREIIETRKAMVFSDVRQDPRVNPEMHDRVRSMIGIPLIGGDRVVGVLFVNDKKPHEFTGFEISLLKALANEGATAVQNARLFQSLKLLNQVEVDLASTLDEQKIVKMVVESAASTFECMHCTVFQVQGDQMVVTASQGNRGDSVEIGRSFEIKEGIAGWVARNGEPRLVPDTAKEPDFAPGWSAPQRDPGSLVVVPILLETGTYGVISVEHDQAHAFDGHDLWLLETLGLQVTQAIRNARLYRAQERLSVQLERLHQVVQEEDLQGVLDRIVEGVCDILGEGVSPTINLYREETGKFGQRHACGPLTDFLHDLPRPAGTGAYVVATKKPLYLDDVLSPCDGCPSIRQESIDRGVVSFAAIPLIREKQIVGVLFVNSLKPVRFSKEIKRNLELFAGQAAIAIHVHQELQRKIRELEALTEIGKTVSNLGIDQILDLVYKEAMKVMDLRDAQVQVAFYDRTKDQVTFPLAVEQDKESGGIIDTVRWGKREKPFRKRGEKAQIKQFQPRTRREPPGLTEYVIRNQESVLIVEDFERKAQKLGVQVWPVFGRLNRTTHSWLGVPMIVQGEVTGIISIQSLEIERAFDRGHVKLLETVANQAAVAIENARLLKEERERAKQLEGLQRIGLKITSSLDLEEVLYSIAENTNSILKADFTTIFPYTEGQGFGEGARAGKFSARPSAPREGGISDRIVRSGQPIQVEDAASFPGMDPDLLHDRKVKSFIGVPLKFRDRVVGVILANYVRKHLFTYQEQNLAEQVAALAAVAIENATRVELIADRERYMTMVGLAADLVHRINNKAGTIPIRVQQLEARLDMDDSKDPELRRIVQRIEEDARDLLAESAELEQLSESEATPEPSLVSIRERLETIASKIQLECPESIEVVTDVAGDLPLVRAVPEELDHALWSVANNGVEAMLAENKDQGGMLIIRAQATEREDGQWIEIRISDQGPGVPHELRERLFEPFHSTRHGRFRGFGLWRARQVLRKLGGSIQLAETKAPGATFVIELPAAPVSAEAVDGDS